MVDRRPVFLALQPAPRLPSCYRRPLALEKAMMKPDTSTKSTTIPNLLVNKSQDTQTTLRLLLLDDSEHDAETILRELRNAGIAHLSARVHSHKDFHVALAEFKPEL